MSHKHYFRDVSKYREIDVYRLLDVFGVVCPVAQHVVKKAIAAGQRGHKTLEKDWQDIGDSAARKLSMIAEDLSDAFGQLNTFDFRDPRTVEGVDVAFDTEKHLSFAPRHCADCSAEHCACVAK